MYYLFCYRYYGREADEVWSLGVVIYAMFSGEHLFFVSEGPEGYKIYISPDELYPTMKRHISFGKKMQLIYNIQRNSESLRC